VEPQYREKLIAEAAYFRSEQRDFSLGRELDDWLAAELEVDSQLNQRRESIDEPGGIGAFF
jgi:hypothetical protein